MEFLALSITGKCQLLRHAQVYDGCDILDVATGLGYSAAVLCKRLGDGHVTSVDVNPYLTTIAEKRLASIGHAPKVFPADATGPLPGTYDRIVAMAGFRPVPASWLAALRPGGRLVTVIDRTALILTADKTEGDWAATGRIEWDRAVFMPARPGGYRGEAHARSVRDEVDALPRKENVAGGHFLFGITRARTAPALRPGLPASSLVVNVRGVRGH